VDPNPYKPIVTSGVDSLEELTRPSIPEQCQKAMIAIGAPFPCQMKSDGFLVDLLVSGRAPERSAKPASSPERTDRRINPHVHTWPVRLVSLL